MHELSLCENIVQIIEEQAKIQGYRRVKMVWLEVGGLAGVETEALRFGFDVVTKNSVAEGAHLEILTTPGLAWCMHCAETVAIERRYDECPRCGGYQLQVTGGDELRIKELEVE